MGLLSELRRRNVVRMATLYVVAAWLIIQVAGQLIDLAHLPDWVGPAVLVLIGLGFPIALALSWFYELTPEGIALEKDVEPAKSARNIRGRKIDLVVISLLCAAVLMFAYDKWWPRGPLVTSLAVMPIDAISSDLELGYFAEAMTEALIEELGALEGLRVTSRTSAMHFKASGVPLTVVARELGVDALLEGSIQPLGENLRIALRLIDGRTDRRLWSETYDSDPNNIMTVQGDVVRSVAEEIQISLAPDTQAHLATAPTDVPEAFRYWVIGEHHLRESEDNSYELALAAFNQAIKLDPEYADAYAGIARAHFTFSTWRPAQFDPQVKLAESAAEKALSLDPNSAGAHITLAFVNDLNWNWSDAETAYINAARLSPSTLGPQVSSTHAQAANFMIRMGHYQEALRHADQAVSIDPVDPFARLQLAQAMENSGQEEAASEQYQLLQELDPNDWATPLSLAMFHAHLGRFDKAAAIIEDQKGRIGAMSPRVQGLWGQLSGLVGFEDQAKQILSRLREKAEMESVPSIAFASIHLGLKEYDEAMTWLEAAYAERDWSMSAIGAFWGYDDLRDRPRFQALLAKMDFPD